MRTQTTLEEAKKYKKEAGKWPYNSLDLFIVPVPDSVICPECGAIGTIIVDFWPKRHQGSTKNVLYLGCTVDACEFDMGLSNGSCERISEYLEEWKEWKEWNKPRFLQLVEVRNRWEKTSKIINDFNTGTSEYEALYKLRAEQFDELMKLYSRCSYRISWRKHRNKN